MRKDIPQAERTYLFVPYAEREEAKALGACWDAVQKSWYVGSEADLAKFATWAGLCCSPSSFARARELFSGFAAKRNTDARCSGL